MGLALVLALVAFATTAVGALGGIGGAVLLVPALALGIVPVAAAAPLGLVSVAAGSISAGDLQLRQRTVNHRLGITTEVAATLGATIGALASGLVGERALSVALAAVAVLAAAAMLLQRSGAAAAADREQQVGEWPGQLAGVAPAGRGGVVYRARRLPLGLALFGATGVVAGIAGTGGGFLKTPVTAAVMGVPTKVAAATTTFTVGITAAAGLVVFAAQGRIDPTAAAAVIAGSLLGGRVGAAVQPHVPTAVIRVLLAVALVAIAVVLVVTA